MEIVVEIGTAAQQKLIRKELKFFKTICKRIPRLSVLKKIIVPVDFDRTINELEDISSYVSNRGKHIGMARIVRKDESYTIVISPIVYMGKNDSYIRYLLFFHEMIHVLNGIDTKANADDSPVVSRNRVNLTIFFDEYCANRTALELHRDTIPYPSFAFKRYIIVGFNSFFNSLVDDSIYYDMFRRKIWNFRTYKIDVEEFLKRIHEPFDQALKCVAYSFAYIDVVPHFAKKEDYLIGNSKFVNDKTMSLINYIRGKYLVKDFDISDGLGLMEDFMTNFGMRFDDLGGGREYLHVLDI